ncbi:MAG: EAL domain-containing protein [Leptolyngbya sp. SIO1E4]|nr:EAL domain-containing protein [Leptolyngbya sp. SIO1E4]
MLEQYLQILLIEDDIEDAELLREYLELADSIHCGLVHVKTLADGLNYLSSKQVKSCFDIVLLDLSLPDTSGIATIEKVARITSEIPIVVLTGLDDEESAINALRAGAQDYLVKGKINDDILKRTIQHSIERKQLLNRLLLSEERYAIAIQGANDGLWDWDLNQQKIYFSPRWKLMLGYTEEEITNHPDEWLHRIHPEHLQMVIEAITRHITQQDDYLQIEHQVRHKNGDYIWGLCRGMALWDSNKHAYRMAGSLTDITQRKYLEQKLFEEKELAMITLQSIGDAVITTDTQGIVESLNPAAEALTGWTLNDAKGQAIEHVFRVVDEETLNPLPNPVKIAVQQDQVISLSNHPVLLAKDNTSVAIDDSTAPIHSSDGQVMGSVVVFHDVTEARGRARQLSWQANHDSLTGLLNRSAFSKKVEEALEDVRNGVQSHVLCFIDLDHFKVVNDTCGHAAGDELLKQIAQLIQDHVRKTDAVARIGGDEFAVLLCECPLETALRITNSLCNTLSQFRFARQNRVFKVGSSIGLSLIDNVTSSVDETMKAADAACYVAKRRGRNRVHVYQYEDQGLSRYSDEAQWFTRLSDAIENDQFQLFYQPIMLSDSSLGNIHSCEVLLRLVDEHGHIVSPAAFIPAAERYSLMPEIDRWVIRHCFEYLNELREQNLQDGSFDGANSCPLNSLYSINLSAASIDDDRFLRFIQDQLDHYKIPPEIICFEITETAAISNLNKAVNFIDQLKQLGCQFALDDFGTGMSSLSYLRILPVDYLKIDGSFIQDIADDQIACAMVEAINHVAHLMGLRTVAEFVSNGNLLEKLKTLGVDYIQGYAIAMPSPLTAKVCESVAVRE